MLQFRIRGPRDGSNLGTVSAAIGGLSDSALISAYRFPSAQTVLPTISDAFQDGTLTPDDKGITVTTRIWRIVGGAVQGNGATLSAAGVLDQWIEYSPDNGVTWSPPTMVSHLMGSHAADEAAVLTIVPHNEATHIAVANGDWTNPSTWLSGRVPRNGAFVLIPHGISVSYNNEEVNIRLDRVRVDGTLWVDAANLTTEAITMLVETIVVTQHGTFTAGTGPSNRIPATASVEIIISGKDYSAISYLPTDIKVSRFQASRGWERGFIVQGVRRLWGAEKLTWAKADPIDTGATSLTLHKVPTGWAIGDTIVIGGTNISVVGPGTFADPQRYARQDEEVVITNIDGQTIHFERPGFPGQGVIYPHKNQLAGSTRTDLYPNVMLKRGKNITIRSEVTSPVWRRGHDVQMHHHTVVDLWDTQFIDLGRTNKNLNSGIIKTSAPDQLWAIPEEPGYGLSTMENRPLSNRSNLQSRYSIHLHHVGFNHTGARPLVSNCYVEGSPGWAVVHHSCDADFHGLAIYKFFGCGLVSEQGDELGAWVDCLAMGATTEATPRAFNDKPVYLNRNPKIGDIHGATGDGFRQGYGFGFRGRAMRTNRCVANSVGYGHVFFNRGDGDPSKNIVPMARLQRPNIDLAGVAAIKGSITLTSNDFDPINYPIIHHSDNEAVATLGGLFVTKANQRQTHDVNIKIKRMKSWGYVDMGAMVEYIGTYILDQFDCVAGPDGYNGIIIDANTYQVAVVNARVEGGVNGIKIGAGGQNFTASQVDPRWVVFGLETVNISGSHYFFGAPAESGSTNEESTRVEDDFDGTFIDYDQDPSESYPIVMTRTAADGNSFTFQAVNDPTNPLESIHKTDNLSFAADLCPKPWDDLTITSGNRYFMRKYSEVVGHYERFGEHVLVYTDIISDRLTARPHKFTKLMAAPAGALWIGPFHGTYSYTNTEVTVSDVTAVVANDGSIVLDILSLANPSGGTGSFTLDTVDTIKADHGLSILDGDAGTVTYMPDTGYLGTDEFYVFVKSGSQYGTVRINILITETGVDTGITPPAETTHFTVADGGSQIINMTLLAPPDASNRRIERTFYSTDDGVTWRRLCHGWKQMVHKITVKSDGTAITAGSYNMRIRYKTDHDYIKSTPSADAAVTVA